MTFQYSHFLGVRDIVVSKQRRQLPQGHQSQAHEYQWQEMMGEAGRKSQDV